MSSVPLTWAVRSWEWCEMSNKASEVNGVRVVTELAIEMRNAVIALAGERNWGETRQRWLERAARRAGITYRSARALFYCEPHQPRAAVLHSVRAAVEELKKSEAKPRDTEIEEMRSWMATLQGRLERLDSEFFVREIEALGAATPAAGGETDEPSRTDRPLGQGDAE